MMTLSKKLERQVKKVFGENTVGALQQIPHAFFELVDSSYSQYEDRLKIANRNIEISSEELNILNGTVNSVLNSLGQGFVIFDKNGICSQIFSKITEDLLETIPRGKNVLDILKTPQEEREELELWIRLMFEEKIKFNEIAILGPKKFRHSKNRSIHLEFKPIRNFNAHLESVLMICTDRTNEEAITFQMKEKEDFVNRIVKLAKEKKHVLKFLDYCEDVLSEICTCDMSLIEYRRKIHTLKGGAASFMLTKLKNYLENFECEMNQKDFDFKASKKDVSKQVKSLINDFLTEYGSIISIQNSNLETLNFEVSKSSVNEFLKIISKFPEIQNKFADNFLKVSLQSELQFYEERIAEIAINVSKQMRPLSIDCGNIKIFPKPYAHFFSSLIHVFRNSLDHGIEMPEERLLRGKSIEGTIQLRGKLETVNSTDGFVIEIQDDGNGIDTTKLRRKLKKQKASTAESSDEELIQLLLSGDLSSSDQVTELSGRGVGLSAVCQEVIKCNGSLEVLNKPGKGLTLKIFLPFLN